MAAPTPTHPEIVAAALDTGLHVLCEKPLALDVAEARRARSVWRPNGAWSCRSASGAGSRRRGGRPRRGIDAGEIGTPIYLRLAQWDADPPPPEFCDPAVSGGLAVDCGVHEFDLAEWLTGRAITQVSAWALPIVDPAVGAAGDVDNLVAVLELDGGAVATVDLSRNARYGDDVRTEVLGSNGALLVDLLPSSRTRLGSARGMRELPESSVDDAMAVGVADQARAFARAVRGEAVDIPGAQASVRATDVGRAVIAATASGGKVEVARST